MLTFIALYDNKPEITRKKINQEHEFFSESDGIVRHDYLKMSVSNFLKPRMTKEISLLNKTS